MIFGFKQWEENKTKKWDKNTIPGTEYTGYNIFSVIKIHSWAEKPRMKWNYVIRKEVEDLEG